MATLGNLRWMLPMVLAGCASENGLVAIEYVDSFLQVPTDQVDILFVVDNSVSMAEEQRALSAGFRSFVQELVDADNDFHIGVIPTDQDANPGVMVGDPPFLTRDDDYVTEFRARAALGTRGTDKEKGLQAAVHALAPHMQIRENLGFLRTQANLLVVIVSDEDDCSDYGALDGRPALDCYQARDELVPVRDMVSRIVGYKAGGRAQISAIIGPFDRSCGDDAVPGYRYAEAVLQTGGTLDRICEDDWGEILAELGLNALGLVRQYRLTHAADPDTIVVLVDGEPIPEDPDNGWTYDAQHWIIYFHGASIPQRGAQIAVTYQVAPYGDVPPGALPEGVEP